MEDKKKVHATRDVANLLNGMVGVGAKLSCVWFPTMHDKNLKTLAVFTEHVSLHA